MGQLLIRSKPNRCSEKVAEYGNSQKYLLTITENTVGNKRNISLQQLLYEKRFLNTRDTHDADNSSRSETVMMAADVACDVVSNTI